MRKSVKHLADYDTVDLKIFIIKRFSTFLYTVSQHSQLAIRTRWPHLRYPQVTHARQMCDHFLLSV